MFAQSLNFLGVAQKDLEAMMVHNYNELLDLDS